MDDDEVLRSVWEGTLRLFGVDVKCHVLEDGTRIIEEESLITLLKAMEKPGPINQHEIEEFVKWQKSS